MQLKTYQFGEKVVDRLEFEETALRAVDPNVCAWPVDQGVVGEKAKELRVSAP